MSPRRDAFRAIPVAGTQRHAENAMTNSNGRRSFGAGWSPELLTVLGAVLAVGVALGTLIFTGLDQVRADMRAMETRLREDARAMETRLREDTRELRDDVGQVRERVSTLEGRLAAEGESPAAL